MELLRRKYLRLLNFIKTDFKRYLYNDIDWNSNFIIIKGQRGVGKTTLMLQYIKSNIQDFNKSLYISLDDIYFAHNTLSNLVEKFVINGGTHLFIDEIHRYVSWSKELKNIYDFYPELKIVATGSSALEIKKGEADLSRRASVYHLHEMSFREYLSLMYGNNFQIIKLDEIIINHESIATDINKEIKTIPLHKEYLQQGAYPFVKRKDIQFYDKLNSVINIIIDNDIPAIENITYETSVKLKKLLYLITTAVPFKPNISELSKKVGTSRDMLLKYIYLLSGAGIINFITHTGVAGSLLRKPDKIYLNNTTLMYALHNNPNIGTIRETFFLNQLMAKHLVAYPKVGDFLIDNKYLFEVGGKNKTQKQIAGIKNSFIVADDIEYGFGNKIPLWLFGFLY
ncbi:MAG: AAA family ATPase [Bacteroidales bacterium]|nr:AAA family ATPase [Bacteroidales bacterium]